MEVFMLTREKFTGSLSGKGAALKGARWNSASVEIIYTAANRSLAMAEVAVHFSVSTLPDDYMMMTLLIPDDIEIIEITTNVLPPGWNKFPHPPSTQAIGDKFVTENRFCILKIPSVVTKGDFNFLINPHHTGFSRIKIVNVEKFPFDKRIFK
jgi:RES domain-containing protein